MTQTVLLVDDSPLIHVVVGSRLRQIGLRVLYANGGQEGLRSALEHRPDLLLLDIDMPDLSGFDVLGRLKADPCISEIPVIFLSAEASLATRSRCLMLGAKAYLTKPFDPIDLRAQVEAALREKARRDDLAERVGVDPLTRRPGRRQLEAFLTQRIQDPARGDRVPAVVVFDVSGMRRFNQVKGHAAGDAVLVALVRHLVGQDINEGTFRLVGDRVAVVCSTDGSSARQRQMEDLRNQVDLVARRMSDASAPLGVTAGAAVFQGSLSPALLIRAAEEALSRAKAAGGNQLVAPAWRISEPPKSRRV